MQTMPFFAFCATVPCFCLFACFGDINSQSLDKLRVLQSFLHVHRLMFVPLNKFEISDVIIARIFVLMVYVIAFRHFAVVILPHIDVQSAVVARKVSFAFV